MLRGLLTEKSFDLSAAFTFVSGKYTIIRDKMREVMEDGRKLSGVVGGGEVGIVKEAVAAAGAVVAGWGGPGLFDASVGRIGEDQQSGKRKDRGWRRAKFRFWT